MPEIDPVVELGRKLLREGAPRHYVVRVVKELVEHRDDLEAEGLAAGHLPDVARSAAREKLGDIEEVARELLAAKRRSYWWGRHPVVSFVLLPLPMFFLLFLGILWLWGEASGLIAWTEHKEGLAEPDWAAVRVGFYTTLSAALTISAGFICFLARRCCCGLKWTLIGCAVFLGQALFLRTGFTPPDGVPGHGNFWIGFGIGGQDRPELIAWIVPLILSVLYCFAVRRAQLHEAANWKNPMKAIMTTSMCLALLATGCASNKVIQQRGWIGGEFLVAKRPSWRISGGDAWVIPALPKQLEGSQKAAIFVSEVYSNTPLAVAGLHSGDLILAVNRQPVEKLTAFQRIVDGCKPGSTVSLSVFRDGEAQDHKVTIGRESYKDWHAFAIGIGISSKLEVDLIPNPDFSLIALGYSRSRQRGELHSPRNEFIRQVSRDQKESTGDPGVINGESWRTWLAIFSVGGYRSILSQETVEPSQASLARQ